MAAKVFEKSAEETARSRGFKGKCNESGKQRCCVVGDAAFQTLSGNPGAFFR